MSSNPQPPPPKRQVPIEAVRAFLAGARVPEIEQPDSFEHQPPPDTDVVTTVLRPTETAEEAPAAAYDQGEPRPPRVDTGDPAPHSDLELPSLGGDVVWAYEDNVLNTVQVDDMDKSLYMKQALCLGAVELDIKLLQGQVTVRCRTLSNFEYEVVWRAVQKTTEDGLISLPEQNISYLQWYCNCLQVVAFNGTQMNPPRFVSTQDINACADELRTFHQTQTRDMQAARWALQQTATRVFECKMKICNDNLANMDFWVLADTA